MKTYWYLLKRSWHYAAGLRGRYVLFACLFATANCVVLLQPWFLGKAFDAIQLSEPDVIKQVSFWMLAYAGTMLVFWCIHGPARAIERSVAFRISQRFFVATYDKLRRLPIQWHQDHHSGNVISRLSKAGSGIAQFNSFQFEIIQLFVGFIGPVVILALMAWPLAVLVVVLNTLVLVGVYAVDKRIIYWMKRENAAEHRNGAKYVDYVSNMKTIISLRLGKRTQSELMKGFDDQYIEHMPHVRLNEIKWSLVSMATAITGAGVVIFYIYWQLKTTGVVLVGTTLAAYKYLDDIDQAFGRAGKSFQRVLQNKTDLASASIIEEAEVPNDPYRQQRGQFQNWQQLRLDDLYFYHGKGSEGKLEAISLDIQRGERIALVGGSGAGKSTLMSLLRGLYMPEKGRIKLDDHHFDGVGPVPYTTTLIPQDPDIFENTIEFNICVGVDHTEAELQQAMRLAAFTHVAERLPKGTQSDIRERGVNLSGGEKQRLSVARGLFAALNSSMVLMDEPTSSVDAPTERQIYEDVFAAFKDKTIISSFHRLHLAQWFDTIVVMDAGRIVQQGTFAELSTTPGPFYDMWRAYEAEEQAGLVPSR